VIRAVGFDLDDTLYDHAQYVGGAYRDIAAVVEQRIGIAAAEFFARIFPDWQLRTSRCDRIFADALTHYGMYAVELERELVRVYRAHQPALTPFPGVGDGLRSLRAAGLRIGLLSDGQVDVQRRKLRALKLEDCFDVLVYTGALGREYYKPHPDGFAQLARELAAEPTEIAYVGDNPFVDFEEPHRMGMQTLRVLTGEYREIHPGLPVVHRAFTEVTHAIDWVLANRR